VKPGRQVLGKAVDALEAGDVDTAIRLCRRHLRKKRTDSGALKLLAHALLRANEPRLALTETSLLVRIAPKNPNAWLLHGHVLFQCGDFDEACESLGKTVSIDPLHAQGWHELGLALRPAGKQDAALEALAKAHQADPASSTYRNNYCLALIESGDATQAVRLCRKAIDDDPATADPWHLLGQALLMLSDFDGAQDALEKAHALAPGNPFVTGNLGSCLARQGRHGRGIRLLRQAMASPAASPGTRKNLIRALAESGKASATLAEIKQFHPNADQDEYASAVAEALSSLTNHGHLEPATKLLNLALAELPDNAELTAERARLLIRARAYDDAEHLLDDALVCCPEHEALLGQRVILYAETGRIELATRIVEQSLVNREFKHDLLDGLLYRLNYSDRHTPESIYRLHRAWADTLATQDHPGQHSRFDNSLDRAKKLRIGYVSADFRNHSVAFFFEPLLEMRNRETVEVFCYSNNSIKDDITRRMRDSADHWRQIGQLSDVRAEELIRADGIDILIDLSGHTAGNRLPLFARRPAPVQVTFIGHVNTTGLDTIDYRLCDEITDPPGEQDHLYSESLYRLPCNHFCYQGIDVPPSQRASSESDPVTFGSFNVLPKMTDTTLDLWCEILRQVPGSRLLIKAKQLAEPAEMEHLFTRLERRQVHRDRVELQAWSASKADHLRLYECVDIGLDTTPFNGITTTCEALWMGLPVIALRGDRYVARVAASLLTYAGLEELIGETKEEFVSKAVALAGDRGRLARYHATLREQVAHSPLCDKQAYARHVETAYRKMWQTYVERANETRGSE